MDQDMTGMSDASNVPEHLPGDTEEPGGAERAAEARRKRAAGPTPGQGEDAVLFVETMMLPDEAGDLSPEAVILAGANLEEPAPWYRSRWLYVGAGLAGGTLLAASVFFLLRRRSARRQRPAITRAQNVLGQWSNQLSGQAGRLTNQINRLTRPASKSTRKTGALSGQINRLSGQASKLSGQAQEQISQLASGAQKTARNVIPLRRRTNNLWLKQARQQLTSLPQQAGSQITSIGSAIGATTNQAIGKTQESLAQVRQGVASGAARTGEGIKSGWKFSRNFTLGVTAGAIWAALFTPQSGETMRQHLGAFVPSRWQKKR